MRELKFRAWNESVREMAIGLDEDMEFDFGQSCSTYGLADAISVSHVKVMQFTGLKDIDGNDIYEGDILSHSTNCKPCNCVIEWSDDLGSCGCCYDECESAGFVGRVLKGSDYTRSKLASGLSGMKIIGNIYENPELMEGKP